jgi:hypothetical protein
VSKSRSFLATTMIGAHAEGLSASIPDDSARIVVTPEEPVTIRAYQETDYDQVAALWARISRELACGSCLSSTLRSQSTES